MRQSTIVALIAAAVLSVGLFYLKYEVTELEENLDRINREILAERQTIRVLEAEWSHLNDVNRLKALADRYMQLQPTSPSQIKNSDQVTPASEHAGGRKP